MATKNIVPRGNGEGSIGTSLKRWLKGWFNTLDVSGNVTLGQNIYLSGTDASIRTTDETAFILPKTSVGDSWQRSAGWSYTDAVAHVFRDKDGANIKQHFHPNGTITANAVSNIELFQSVATTVTDITPFISYMNGNERYRVRHDTNSTYQQLTSGTGTVGQITEQTDGTLFIGTNGRPNDLALNSTGTELTYLGYGQNWASRFIVQYDANLGDAALMAYSSGGNTSLRLGTSNAGVYSNQFHMNNLGNIGVGLNASTADRLFVYGGADRSGIYASINGVSNHGSIVKAANAAYEQYLNVWIASRAASPNFGYLTCMSSENGDLEFTLRGDGNAWADGSWNAGGADFAEYFEWADRNPTNEDRRGWSVVLENGKIRKALAAEIPFGVISARPTVVGDAAEHKWADKYLKDDFNEYIMEDYEVVEWTETKVVQDATEAVYQTVTKEREVQATETITEDVSSIELIDGKYTRVVKTETKEIPLFDEFDLYEDGQVIGVHIVPRMVTETYEVEELVSPAQDEKTEDVQHSYAVDEVPDGVVVPVDATRSTQQRRKLNPNYDENQEYVPRSERPEWDCVGLMGKLRVVKGEVVSPNWIKMRDVSGTVEEWLVR
ncbi:peptidase G2 autoproteolytic cleavage domain-containing protein [Terasakiella sp.]|uniref:peptidase G2 autoproteolytic cleavage domain-containing protein n=1 Tax=Terasakiella sp. TaxID=2034861 RepID=UPI003AA8091E